MRAMGEGAAPAHLRQRTAWAGVGVRDAGAAARWGLPVRLRWGLGRPPASAWPSALGPPHVQGWQCGALLQRRQTLGPSSCESTWQM